jgi:hypothetical protein
MTDVLNTVEKEINTIVAAPAIHVNGKASVIKELEAKTGKSFEQVVFGQDTQKDGAEASLNLNNGVYKNFVDGEVIAETVQLKKDIWAANFQAKALNCKVEDTPYFKHILAKKLKAYDLATMTNFTPAMNTQFYVEEFQGIYAGLQERFVQQAMKSKTEDIRSLTGILEGALVSDTSTFTAISQGQGTSQLSAKDCVASAKISSDLIMDASPAAFNDLLAKMVQAVRVAEENAIINGDDSATHQDSDTHALSAGAAGTFAKAFKGLRKLALAASRSEAHAGAWDLSAIQKAVRGLKHNALNPSEVLLITDVASHVALKTGIVSELLTADKAGLGAQIINGGLDRVLGYGIVSSSKARADLNVSGVYDGTTTNNTALIAANTEKFVVGRRGGYKVWSTPTPADADQIIVSAKSRMAFAPVTPVSATETHVYMVRDITAL